MRLTPMARIRVKFFSFAALTAAGIAIGAPIWSTGAALLICVAIPLALALQGTDSVRALLLPNRVATVASPVRKAVRHEQDR